MGVEPFKIIGKGLSGRGTLIGGNIQIRCDINRITHLISGAGKRIGSIIHINVLRGLYQFRHAIDLIGGNAIAFNRGAGSGK